MLFVCVPCWVLFQTVGVFLLFTGTLVARIACSVDKPVKHCDSWDNLGRLLSLKYVYSISTQIYVAGKFYCRLDGFYNTFISWPHKIMLEVTTAGLVVFTSWLFSDLTHFMVEVTSVVLVVFTTKKLYCFKLCFCDAKYIKERELMLKYRQVNMFLRDWTIWLSVVLKSENQIQLKSVKLNLSDIPSDLLKCSINI